MITATRLGAINAQAHVNTFHPGAFDWTRAKRDVEFEFASRVCFDEPGHEREAVAYMTKELAQLAEIERHVAAVLALVLAELQADWSELNRGDDLHYALSCFAAEELQHASTFYRYVRQISGIDPKLADNKFAQRLGLYEGPESAWVKLAALSCSAYVGESLITVYERRTQMLDPTRQFFLTDLIYKHGLDEARHVELDHFVINDVIPRFTAQEMCAMRRILTATEQHNYGLAFAFGDLVASLTGLDFTTGNRAHRMQIQLAQLFGSRAFGAETIRPIDEALTPQDRLLLEEFTNVGYVHN